MGNYGARLWLTSFIGLLGSLGYGYQLGVMNTPLRFIAADLGFPVETYGASIVAALLFGGIGGSLAAGYAADVLGPKRAMQLDNFIFIAGCFASFFSPAGLPGLFTARVLTGFASGALSLFVPRYIAETAPPRIRGALGSLSQLFICSGILLSYTAGIPYIHTATVTWAGIAWWRLMLLIPAAPALVQSLLLGFCPESPIWLRWRGRHAEAHCMERSLGTTDSGRGSNDAEVDAQPLAGDSIAEEMDDVSWMQLLLSDGRHSRMVVLAIGTALTQQLSGINTVIFYSSEVFGKAGLKSPIMGAVLVGIVQIIATVGATAVTDTLGRKPLMVLSHVGMATSLLGITLSYAPGLGSAGSAPVAVACVLLFVVFFSCGSGPLAFLYISEILSSDIKGKVSSVAISLNWLANFCVGLSFPVMLSRLGVGGAYSVYALLNIGCAAFCAALMIETKRQSVQQIHRSLLREY